MGSQLINSECEFIDSFLKISASCQFSVCIAAPSFAAHPMLCAYPQPGWESDGEG